MKANWKYYLDEAEQTQEVQAQLEQIRAERRGLSPEDITFIDPCMGSGHILVYAFDVFMQIYENAGYSQRDAARLILEKNLHGLDIDKRAYQLAYFALFMKARQYNRRILDGSVSPQVYHPSGWSDGEEYGSLLIIAPFAHEGGAPQGRGLSLGAMPKEQTGQLSLTDDNYDTAIRVWNFKRLLSQKYDIVCTNPPYMGGSGMSGRLALFLKDNYTDSKSDLFAAFIERCGALLIKQGFNAMITQHAWMFLSSYEKLRIKLRQHDTVNMAHLGARAFAEISGEVVQSTAFVMRDRHIPDFKGVYVRLVDINDADEKEIAFLSGNHRHVASADNFAKIPGSPVAYWEKRFDIFEDLNSLGKIAEPRQGMATADNDRFLRFWHEVSKHKRDVKWFPYSKGGTYRKWYGNGEYYVNWENDGSEIKAFAGSVIRNPSYYFLHGLAWSALTSGSISFRYLPHGYLFDSKGPVCYPLNDNSLLSLLGLLNSNSAMYFLRILAPTLDFNQGPISKIPVPSRIHNESVDQLVSDNITISRADWDSFETSWDFKQHPLV